MRINSYNKISQIYEAHQASKVKEANKINAIKKKDGVEISNIGRDIQVAKEGLKRAPDIRYDKVNDIIKRMESGTYNISAQEIADKIVNKYFDETI
ncbi:MAG: flagellar biosynthesis anti-sigma factor FlgM [Clostridiales bacterium]|nr:flagellar biosynthesis anti-sigma factor FlgM [Clostridiales bacterium]